MPGKKPVEEKLLPRTFFLGQDQDRILNQIARIKKIGKSEILRMAVDDVIVKLTNEILEERQKEEERQRELERQRQEAEAQKRTAVKSAKPKKRQV